MRPFRPRDAAVVGVGAFTPLGVGAEANWAGLVAGRCAIKEVEPPTAPEGMRLAAFVEPPYLRVEVPDHLQSQAKFLNGSGEMVSTAVAEALAQARFAQAGVPSARRGLYLAQSDTQRSNLMEFREAVIEATSSFSRPLEQESLNRVTPQRVKPWYMLEAILNNAFSLVTAWHELRGANTSLSGHMGVGLQALGLSARAIAQGDADWMICATTARLAVATVRREQAVIGLSSRGRDGAASYRPLDRRRDGTVGGEGAAVMVLEPLEAARARGVDVLGVVVGQGGAWGEPVDGSFGPPADSLVSAAEEAMREADLKVDELLGVVVPGVGTVAGDREALAAARRVLGGADVPVAAWKGATSNLACASDVLESVMALRALREGVFPGTTGFERRDPADPDVRVSRTGVRRTGNAVLVLAGGVEGQALAAVLARA